MQPTEDWIRDGGGEGGGRDGGGAGGGGGIAGGAGDAQILKPVTPPAAYCDEKVRAVVVTPSGPLEAQYLTPSTLTGLS